MLYVLIAASALAALILYKLKPRLDRQWAIDQSRLPTATFDGGRVTIRNVRNFSWRTPTDFDVRWTERTYALDGIRSVDYVVVPFGSFQGMAHSFLTFGFDDGRHLSISAETRREKGEAYNPIRGVLRQYEIIYVIGDERDLIGVRANIRKNTVYLYPIRATRDQVQALFESMLRRANALSREPEFYNTLFNNCATNIQRHVNELLEEPHPYTLRVAIPGYSARFAFEHGLIDTTQLAHEHRPIDTTRRFVEAREAFRIDKRSAWIPGDTPGSEGQAWSKQIRTQPDHSADVASAI